MHGGHMHGGHMHGGHTHGGHTHGGHMHGGHAHHAHGHAHHGNHHAGDARRLRWALAITATFMVAEVVGGILSNSLALLADAGHMLTDAGALALSLFVVWFSRQPATPAKSFGYLRWEIMAALINGSVLLLVCAWIVWEALGRLRTPQEVHGELMLAVAVAGLLVNVAAALILHPASRGSMNVRGAYLHVLGDLLGSVGTIVAALLVSFTGLVQADPIASIVVALIVIRSAWRLVRESVDVLLESVPAHISPAAVRAQIEAIPGVESVHDLHIWTVSTGLVAMSAHAIVREPEQQQHVLEHVHDAMRLFGIEHVTIQLERREMYERERACIAEASARPVSG